MASMQGRLAPWRGHRVDPSGPRPGPQPSLPLLCLPREGGCPHKLWQARRASLGKRQVYNHYSQAWDLANKSRQKIQTTPSFSLPEAQLTFRVGCRHEVNPLPVLVPTSLIHTQKNKSLLFQSLKQLQPHQDGFTSQQGQGQGSFLGPQHILYSRLFSLKLTLQ
jgi:hypothetical protein